MSCKLAIFASGSGTNAENIANYFRDHKEIEVAVILCNKENAGVFERAKRLGIPAIYATSDKVADGKALCATMKEYHIDFIVLAGYLRKIPSELIAAYPNKIVNIHPALLPKYGGKGMYGDRVHEQVLNNGEKESGISIHIVNEAYDEGDILFQKAIDIQDIREVEVLAGRIHELEYAHYPKTIESQIKVTC